MVTHNQNGLVRVTVTLQPEDVAMLDELGRLEGSNRSEQLRGLLAQVRPMVEPVIAAFREAERSRRELDQKLVNATVTELEAIQPEVEEMGRRFMGMMAKLEGAAAAAAEAPASNTGATDS
jgi:Ribbon-helix-helix protein, copG family